MSNLTTWAHLSLHHLPMMRHLVLSQLRALPQKSDSSGVHQSTYLPHLLRWKQLATLLLGVKMSLTALSTLIISEILVLNRNNTASLLSPRHHEKKLIEFHVFAKKKKDRISKAFFTLTVNRFYCKFCTTGTDSLSMLPLVFKSSIIRSQMTLHAFNSCKWHKCQM